MAVRTRAYGFAAFACAVAAGCSSHHRNDLVVGKDPSRDASTPTAGRAGQDTTAGGRSGASAAPAGGSRALDADIQNREGVTLDLVTVACAGDCFEVVAVARGGYPPYTYVWEDGSTNAERKLCPDASRAFVVKATDRGYESDEFKRAAETATASVNAQVLSCPDAAVPDAAMPQPEDAGTPDAGSDPEWRALFIPNGSFDNATGGAPWRYCFPSNPGVSLDITDGSDLGQPQPVDGMYFLRMAPEPGQPLVISVPLCEAVATGTSYYWTQSWALGVGSGPIALSFHLSNRECGLDGLLSELNVTESWTRVCSSWPALWDAQWLTIRAEATSAFGGTVFIDELLSSSAMCPARSP
jgi:hypothetical protein